MDKSNETNIKLAKCEYCNEVMLLSEGCKTERLMMSDGKVYERIKVGDKYDSYYGKNDKKMRCRDCNALFGHYHHEGCDYEICPKCHEQILYCDC